MKEVIFLGKRTKAGSPRKFWPTADLWGVTHSNQKYAKRHGQIDDWTEWWDIHPINSTPFYKGIKAKRPKTFDWYKTLPGPGAPNYRPLWLLDDAALEVPPIPAARVFDWREVFDAFPIDGEIGRWFTCQVDWMFGAAILRRYEHIILHGHGVSLDPRHMVAHRGILYWLAVARERGIKVTIMPPSWYLAPEKPYAIAAGGMGVAR